MAGFGCEAWPNLQSVTMAKTDFSQNQVAVAPAWRTVRVREAAVFSGAFQRRSQRGIAFGSSLRAC